MSVLPAVISKFCAAAVAVVVATLVPASFSCVCSLPTIKCRSSLSCSNLLHKALRAVTWKIKKRRGSFFSFFYVFRVERHWLTSSSSSLFAVSRVVSAPLLLTWESFEATELLLLVPPLCSSLHLLTLALAVSYSLLRISSAESRARTSDSSWASRAD